MLILEPNKAAAEWSRRQLYYFLQEFWDIIVEDDLVLNWHMEALCDEIQEVYDRVIRREHKLHDLIINIPPGTSKSTICTIMAPVWSWTRDPSLRHITGSYSDALSTEHAVKSRDIIRSDRFRKYFPYVQIKPDEDNKTNYKTVRNGQRFATSIGGTVTGVHGHILTFDDPLNPKQAASIVELDTANRFLDSTLSTRKVDKSLTPLILIMQRLAVNDPSGYLLEKKKDKIRHVCLPGSLSDDVKPEKYRSKYVNGYLDNERLGHDVLEEMRIDLGAANYAGQVEQTPVPPGGLTWKKWFIEIEDDQWPSREDLAQLGTDWDLAYTEEDANSASAYVTAGTFENRIYIDDFGWEWKEFPDLVEYMKSKPSPHFIEAKASGKSAKQTLVSQGVAAIEVKVKGGKDKIARAQMATPVAEAELVCIRKSMADRLYNDPKQGLLFFPRGKYKDLADAIAQAIQRLHYKNSELMFDENELAFFESFEGESTSRIGIVVFPGEEYGNICAVAGLLREGKIFVDQVLFNEAAEVGESDVSDMIYGQQLQAVNIDGNKAWLNFAKNVRNQVNEVKGYDDCYIRVVSGGPNKHATVLANADFIRQHFAFKRDYKGDPHYNRFMEGLFKYTRSKESQKQGEAAVACAELARYFQSFWGAGISSL